MLKFRDLLSNPAGRGSAQIGARYLILRHYNEVAFKLLNSKSFSARVYSEGTGYVMYFSIPSEKYDLTFDTIIRLKRPDVDEDGELQISDYGVEVFSNIPSFGFIYAYVVNDNGFFIEELKNKFDQIFFTKPPVVRNPSKTFGFEKAITIASIYIERNKLKFKRNLDSAVVSEVDWNVLNTVIPSFNRKLSQYNGLKKQEIEQNKKSKAAAAKAKQKAKSPSNVSNQSTKVVAGKVPLQVKPSQLQPILSNKPKPNSRGALHRAKSALVRITKRK